MHKIQKIREHTKFLVALGDCAVTGNVPSMRNTFGVEAMFERAYVENADAGRSRFPTTGVPPLLDRVRPVHEIVKVDVFVPGCPPPADAIFFVVSELLAGRDARIRARLDALREVTTRSALSRRITNVAETIIDRSGHPHRGARQDHDPARRRRATSTDAHVPRHPVPRL